MLSRRAFILAQLRREPDEFRDRLIAHLNALDVFARLYFGCPSEGDVTPETCKQWRAETNTPKYEQARKTAMKLFDLRD